MEQSHSSAQSWLNRTVLGIALASLFSDWSHEIATAVLPAFLGSPGVAAAWLGRGVRTPVRKALLAAAVDRSVYGHAFGFERAMDTLGAVLTLQVHPPMSSSRSPPGEF